MTGCPHSRGHVTDSMFHGAGYATSVTKKIFCDRCRLRRWLHIEAALAKSQADCSIIPISAADVIYKAAYSCEINYERVAKGIHATAHSLVPLLAELRESCDVDSAQFVHFGATTQDIQDTAQSMEMREILDAAEQSLHILLAHLARLAERYREQPMVGRTHGVAALPITFGLKVASWIDELLRHLHRIDYIRPQVVVAQLFGGTGTMSALGKNPLSLLERFATYLELNVPSMAWHAARDRVAEFVNTLAGLTATLARIADEVRVLSSAEYGELNLKWVAGTVGSSTMPHKRNPEVCEQIVTLARLAKAQMGIAMDSMIQLHERDYRGTRLEWCAVPDVSHYCVSALSLAGKLVEGLTVNQDRMNTNLLSVKDGVCTENAMMRMSAELGKENAFQLMYELSQASQSLGKPLQEMIEANPIASDALGGNDGIANVFDPRSCLGQSGALVDKVLAQYRSTKQSMTPEESVL